MSLDYKNVKRQLANEANNINAEKTSMGFGRVIFLTLGLFALAAGIIFVFRPDLVPSYGSFSKLVSSAGQKISPAEGVWALRGDEVLPVKQMPHWSQQQSIWQKMNHTIASSQMEIISSTLLLLTMILVFKRLLMANRLFHTTEHDYLVDEQDSHFHGEKRAHSD